MLFDLAEANNSGMILLTESHWNKNIPDEVINRKGWTIVRSDIVKRICGGVVGIIREDFPIRAKLNLSTSYCEVMVINFSTINLINVTIYRPPECPFEHFSSALDQTNKWIKNIECNGDTPKVLVNGDFNFRFMSCLGTRNTP